MHLFFNIVFTTTASLLPTPMPLLLESLFHLVLINNLSSAPCPMGPLPWSIPVPYQEDQAKEHQQENHSHQDHNNYGPWRE